VEGTFHDLRRTCITRWTQGSLSPQEVKMLAGHASIETTMSYYAAIRPDVLDRARAIGVSGLEPPAFGPPVQRSIQTELHPV